MRLLLHVEVSICGKSGDLEPSGESHRSIARYGSPVKLNPGKNYIMDPDI